MNTGWEVRPLGWILLALLIGGVLYYFVSKLTRPPQDNYPPTKSFPNF